MPDSSAEYSPVFVKAGDYDSELPGLIEQLCGSFQTVEMARLPSLSFLRSERPYFIIHCGNDEDICLQNAKAIINNPQLYNYPLIIIGFQVDEIQGVLESFFSTVSSVPLPYSKSDVFEAIEFTKSNYPDLDLPAEQEASAGEAEHSEDAASAVEEARADLTLQIALELESLPKELFKHLTSLDLNNLSLGGRGYSSKIDLNFLSMSGMLTEDRLDPDQLEKELEANTDWSRGHLCRTYFICRKIADALQFDEDQRELLAQSAFHYMCAVEQNHNKFLRTNYYESNLPGLRDKIANAIFLSAEKAEQKLVDPRVGAVITRVSELVKDERIDFASNESVLAAVLMGADLIDRVCFFSGLWNPRAAYQLMRKLKSGYLKELPAGIWSALVKFLSEAIASRQSLFVIPKDIRKNEQLMSELKKIRNMPVKPGEERIPVAELKPGMHLTQPLWTFDGKKVLSSGIKVDQDLVWRIWQLSAVRPLNSPVVKKEGEQEVPNAAAPVQELPDPVSPPEVPKKPLREEGLDLLARAKKDVSE